MRFRRRACDDFFWLYECPPARVGSSQLAVDVLSGITVEYLANVGRTFRFYLDKYSNTMTSEVCHSWLFQLAFREINTLQEIILHSLFESGVSRIQGLERYITDDIVRHGNRLNDLEKKIVNVYQEFTSAEAIDDDTLFANEDDEEEESAFVMYALTRARLFSVLSIANVIAGANSPTISAKTFSVYANSVSQPSSVSQLSQSPNDSSKARKTPNQTPRTRARFRLPFHTHTY